MIFSFLIAFLISISSIFLPTSVMAQAFTTLKLDGQAKQFTTSSPLKSPLLKLHLIDIGQGDSLLLQTPNQKNIVIDTGPSSAKKRLQEYLISQGVSKIDLLIHTHAHSDHIGSSVYLIENFEIKTVLESGFVHPTTDYQKTLEALEAKSIPVKIARKGRNINISPDLTLTILAPEDPLIDGSRSDVNANSIVIKVSYLNHHFLLMGDAELETEERLLKSPELLKADLLKVAHHGSKHASSEKFLDAVQPKLALISCSETNSFGHPAPQTLKKFQDRKIDSLSTAEYGTVVVSSDGKNWDIKQFIKSEEADLGKSNKDQKRKKMPKTPVNIEEAEQAEYDQDLIDLNKATKEQLNTLPGVGPKLAEEIDNYRKITQFEKPQDLMEVKGIGEKKYEGLKHKLRPIHGIKP